MTAVNLRFAPESAKAAGLLEQLLAFHGLNVSSAPLASNGVTESPCVLAVPRQAANSASGAASSAWTMIMDPDPGGEPPAGALEFTKDGVTELVRRLRSVNSCGERRRSGQDRRRWDIRRFRFGLWLEFSRSTGASKFDVFPLTYSNKMKARKALLPELGKYDYPGGRATDELLDQALARIWEDQADPFPTAVRVVESVADVIWEDGKPQMRDRRRPAAS